MKLIDTLLLVLLAAIWGSSFIFMRATVDVFGPITLIAIRSGVAALFLIGFLSKQTRWLEFKQHWRTLAWIGVLNSALPFCFLAYTSLYLTAGTVSILNAMTPIFTAWIAHIWLKDQLTCLQYLGLVISIAGLSILVWDKVSWDIKTWWPILAGLMASLLYGIASNGTKRYLKDVSSMTAAAGSLFFSAIFMFILVPFFSPDFSQVTPKNWLYAITLGVLCTAFAYVVFFHLLSSIGPSRAVSVTFLIPVFSFLWGYLLLGEVVTIRMWIATLVILLGMSLVLRIMRWDGFKSH